MLQYFNHFKLVLDLSFSHFKKSTIKFLYSYLSLMFIFLITSYMAHNLVCRLLQFNQKIFFLQLFISMLNFFDLFLQGLYNLLIQLNL